MKQKAMIFLLALMVLPALAGARVKQVNVVGTLGMATGYVERAILNLGIEVEVLRNIYAQASFDNFLTDDDMSFYLRDGQLSYYPRLNTRVFGLNLAGAFKLPLSRRTAWFAKAGLSFSFRSRYSDYYGYYDDFYWYDDYDYFHPWHYPDRNEENPARTGLAYALGTGIEFRLSEKLAVNGGGTYESLFDQTPPAGETGGRGDWVKIYVGFSYRVW